MGTWNDLPPEIRDIILNFFCYSIVHEFVELGKDPWRGCDLYWVPRGPKSPASFTNLLSALRTCRYFQFVIQDIIKIDNTSTIEKLELLQYKRVHDLAIRIPVHGLPTSIVARFKELAGKFWVNPHVMSSLNLMEELLEALPVESRTLIIPHLRTWLFRHARPAKPTQKYCTITIGWKWGDHFHTRVKFRRGSFKVKGFSFEVVSLAGVDCILRRSQAGIWRKFKEGRDRHAEGTMWTGNNTKEKQREQDGQVDVTEETEHVDHETDHDFENIIDLDEDSSDDEMEESSESDLDEEDEDRFDDEMGESYEFDAEDDDYDEIYNIENGVFSTIPMVRDVWTSEPNSWWLFRSYEYENSWYMCKYYTNRAGPGCKIYEGLNAYSGMYWNGEADWSTADWLNDKTLEEYPEEYDHWESDTDVGADVDGPGCVRRKHFME